MKKETTSEGFYRISKEIDYPEFDILSFKIGVEWQQQKVYSEEEVLELLRKAHFVEQNIEEWFEQFKKK